MASSHSSKQLHLTTIALATGQASSPSSIAASIDVPPKHQVLHSDGILSWTENKGRTLKFAPWGRKVSPIAIEIPNDVRETSFYALKDKIAVHFKTHSNSWVDLYHVNTETQEVSKLLELPPRIGAHSASSLSSSGGLTYLVWNLPGETILYDTKHPEVLATYIIPNQTINAAFGISEVAPRPDGASYAMRTFVSSVAPGFVGDSYLIRSGDVAWSRKESLSSIVASIWVELLDQAAEEIVDELKVETHTNIASAYVHRVKRHLNELVLYGPDWLKALPHRIYGAFLNAETVDTEHTGKWRDFFGFRKFAIVVTAEGGLAAIDVGKGGEVVWEAVLASPEAKFQGISGIYEVRKGTVGVVTVGGDYVEYDAFEGILLHQDKLAATVKATSLVDTPAKAKAVVALLDNGDAAVLPSGGGFGLEPVHLSIKESARAVKGIRISGSSQPVTTWTFVPPALEEVTSFATRPAHDPVASIGRVLGDRSVMYKYLNQHLLVVTTVNPVLSTASIYLLDAVSGSILHSATHAGADTSQPIVATVSENWLVYTFFGDNDVIATPGAAKSYQLVISELYESEFKNDRGTLGPAANVSSFTSSGKPHVLSQSYIFPSPVTSFAVTSTKQGITSREVLALLAGTSQIFTIPKRVLDPRRPVGRDTDAAEKEEGLFKYTPVIDIEPKAVLTHERKMLGLKQIATTSSMLESTSLVFAYGGDLFGTRVTPSMPFDILGKGFGKIQLVLTIVALTVGTVVVAPMVRRKQINSRWAAT